MHDALYIQYVHILYWRVQTSPWNTVAILKARWMGIKMKPFFGVGMREKLFL